MSLVIGEVKTEATGFGAPREDAFVSRVYLSEGAEGLRHAYGPSFEAAESNLMTRLDVVAEVGDVK